MSIKILLLLYNFLYKFLICYRSTEDHGTSAFPDRCFYERSTSSSRLAGNSVGVGSVAVAGVVGTTEPAEFVGGGRGGNSRGSSAATTATASTTYHGDAVSTGGGRSTTSSSSSAAPPVSATPGGRSRERTGNYRNGPYGAATSAPSTNAAAAAASVDGRHSSRTATNNWGYDSTRYNSTGNNQTDTGYCTTPSENNERRNSDQSSNKKKTKSRSGSRSPSPSGSTSSRSPSR